MGRTAGLPSTATTRSVMLPTARIAACRGGGVGPDGGLAVHGDYALGDAAHREDCGLRRGDDRAELVHVIHAEVADGERGVGNVGRAQLSCPCALGHVATLRGN